MADDVYVVTWRDPRDGEIVTLRARTITDSGLGLTFVAISDFVWETGSALVNPAHEALVKRFQHTKTLHLSIHTVITIEEVGGAGLVLQGDRSNLVLFPPDKR